MSAASMPPPPLTILPRSRGSSLPSDSKAKTQIGGGMRKTGELEGDGTRHDRQLLQEKCINLPSHPRKRLLRIQHAPIATAEYDFAEERISHLLYPSTAPATAPEKKIRPLPPIPDGQSAPMSAPAAASYSFTEKRSPPRPLPRPPSARRSAPAVLVPELKPPIVTSITPPRQSDASSSTPATRVEAFESLPPIQTSHDALKPPSVPTEESPLTPSMRQPPSPATARRKRMSKLRRHLGERPPSTLVLSGKSISRRSRGSRAMDAAIIQARIIAKLEADTLYDVVWKRKDVTYGQVLHDDMSSEWEDTESEEYEWSRGEEEGFKARVVKRYSKKWIREKGSKRWIEQRHSAVLRALRRL